MVSAKETNGKAPFIQRQRNEKWEISDIASALHVNRQKEILKGFVTSGSKKEHEEPDAKVVYRIVYKPQEKCLDSSIILRHFY